MPSLAGAITALGLLGLSQAAPVFNAEYHTVPRPYTVTFTQLGVAGALPLARHVDFSGKAETTTATLSVSDTASLSATEDPVDSNQIATSDTARLSATEVSSVFNRIDATDTARISAGETVSLAIVGVTLKTASDTASISASDVSALGISITVSDTASISVSESATVDVSTEQISATDTASISADESVLLEIFAGIVDKTVTDTASLSTTDSAVKAEVNRIRRISFKALKSKITFEVI